MSLGQLVNETDSELGLGERSLLVWPGLFRGKSGGRDSDALGGTGRLKPRQQIRKVDLRRLVDCPPGWLILVRLVDESFRCCLLRAKWEPENYQLSIINYQLSMEIRPLTVEP